MKLQLIDQAYNIPNFDYQATELVEALGIKVDAKGTVGNLYEDNVSEQEKLIHFGFKLALDMIKQNLELIKPTLYQTMIVIKWNYLQLTKFKHNYRQVNAISLAVNHLRKYNRLTINEKLHKASVEKYEQQLEQERIVAQLAEDIKKMLKKTKSYQVKTKHYTPVERKPIWALKIKGEGSENAKPFIAGYKQKEVAMNLKLCKDTVRNGLENNIVKGYKLWIE